MSERASAEFIAGLERRHGQRVRRMMFRAGLSEDDVGDVWNRVLIAAWRAGVRPEWFNGAEHEEAWIRALARRSRRYVALYRGRARFRAKACLFSEMETDEGRGGVAFVSFIAGVLTSPGQVEWQDRALLQAWEETPPKQQRAIELVVLQGLTFAEAGRLVGSAKATVSTHVYVGLRKLRERYEALREAA